MTVSNTDMNVVTATFIVFEIIMLLFQLPIYLAKREKIRKYYLILLILLIIKNIAMGLFPDPRISFIPIGVQYGLTYGAGFIMASYFPFYFYKAYDISQLKWHATRGIYFFLHLPFFLITGITYLLKKDIDQAIDNGLIIPAIYGIVLGYVLFNAIREKYRYVERKDYLQIVGVYFAVIPYATLAFFAYFRIEQVNEALLTNGGFAIITLLFVRQSIRDVRSDLERLKEIDKALPDVSLEENKATLMPLEFAYKEEPVLVNDSYDPGMRLEMNMNEFGLTTKEKEVVRLLKLGYTNEEIGNSLNIQVGTVKKHLENTFKKVLVKNRLELIHKLEN
ncbi:helix-turn-helix transcriptional regulator [Dyadobacter psychrotolerans]|jgi:DNA-binding CsgD family transcriptional regulator|uniref:LuxR family transcriptional regulator n=1 Tax=Dyadobacter psychrotolerans TaxID=2541721 RepID=A0A4R5D8E7_9BACT|nr:helix-turn-helix transcriptional regulator [Dyadobacter psychrotolerans]TDE09829.1 LuxR family transcriptional regulator [Dyadobacter psychrotolerans]